MNHLDSDYFSMCSSTGDQFAGRHILADFWGVERMSDLDFIKKTIEESARKAGANILHSYYHPFGDGMGVSGVTVLSESHISIHTWPERSFASIDVLCVEIMILKPLLIVHRKPLNLLQSIRV